MSLEHERNRFATMTVEQLRTRLGRITRVEKLREFISVAADYVAYGTTGQKVAFGRLQYDAQQKLADLLVQAREVRAAQRDPNIVQNVDLASGEDETVITTYEVSNETGETREVRRSRVLHRDLDDDDLPRFASNEVRRQAIASRRQLRRGLSATLRRAGWTEDETEDMTLLELEEAVAEINSNRDVMERMEELVEDEPYAMQEGWSDDLRESEEVRLVRMDDSEENKIPEGMRRIRFLDDE